MLLRRLLIENFGLIERAEVEFSPGLTIFSGETGSGKTMLLGALGFVLGDRTGPDAIRSGADKTAVTLQLEPDEAARRAFARDGFSLDDGEDAIVSRELSAAGKSSARLNGKPATAAQLRALGEQVLDLVGQHEQQRLLAPGYHLEILDRFGGPPLMAARHSVGEAFEAASQLGRELQGLREEDAAARQRNEEAVFAAREIRETALQAGEDERLRERRDYLANVEKIATALHAASEALTADEAGSVDALGRARAALRSVDRFGGELASLAGAIEALQSEVAEVAAKIARARDDAEFDPSELEKIGARLSSIEALKKKYGPTLGDVIEAGRRFDAIVERYENRDERRQAAERELSLAQERLEKVSAELSARRASAAQELAQRIVAELRALAMPSAAFRIAFESLPEISSTGAERAAFEFAASPGEIPRPLAKAASGGELSRVLLALVVVLADRRDKTALVFDEIDAGIGGATATAVGTRLGRLARDAQVVCVTHLAQIASWADRHYALHKRESARRASIELRVLDGHEGLVDELARMLSGEPKGVARDHAGVLLHEVRARKSGSARA